jgi:integrase
LPDRKRPAEESPYAKRYLLVAAKPLHSRPAAAVTRRDIAELLTVTETGVTKGTGVSTASLLRATLSAMFSWAMREGLVEANPAMNTNKREQQSRKRVLPMSELAEIWRSLPDDNFGAAMKLLMLTAQRRHEIGGLRWSEMDEGLTRITLRCRRSARRMGAARTTIRSPKLSTAVAATTGKGRISPIGKSGDHEVFVRQ